MSLHSLLLFFFFNDTATTEIYTLSLHDALPIWRGDRERAGPRGPGSARQPAGARPAAARAARAPGAARPRGAERPAAPPRPAGGDRARHRRAVPPGLRDRKSTRLNSSHLVISYA